MSLLIIGFFPFHKNYVISLFNVRKKTFGIKTWRDWNKYKTLGRTFILIQFILPAKDRYNAEVESDELHLLALL